MNFRLNHIGIVVADIDRYLKHSLSGEVFSDVVDPIQDARIVLLDHGSEHPNTELIQPLSITATTAGYLKRTSGGYHHLCYEAPSIDEVTDYFKLNRIKCIYGPVSAPAFNNQDVIFGYTSNREIIEFVIIND